MIPLALAAVLLVASACGSRVEDEHGQPLGVAADSSRVGMPCLPSDELDPAFSGFDPAAVTIEVGNPICGSGHVCVVDHFQGRVSCPSGQPAPTSCQLDEECASGTCVDGSCTASCFAGDEPVTVSVCGQCSERTAAQAVYCSCRCGPAPGEDPDPQDSYCDCPGGFTCEPLVRWGDLAGSYCVRRDTAADACGSVDGFWAPQCNGLPTGP